MYNRGGQKRTIQATCGWNRKGHPTEVNKLYMLHKKYCKTCSETDYAPPEFNKEAANTNGWNGITTGGQKPTTIQTTCLVEGRRVEVISQANSIEEATRDILYEPTRDTIINIAEMLPKTDKKKKRKNKKNKKPIVTAENEDEIKEKLATALYAGIPEDELDAYLNKYENDPNSDEGMKALADLTGKHIDIDSLLKFLEK